MITTVSSNTVRLPPYSGSRLQRRMGTDHRRLVARAGVSVQHALGAGGLLGLLLDHGVGYATLAVGARPWRTELEKGEHRGMESNLAKHDERRGRKNVSQEWMGQRHTHTHTTHTHTHTQIHTHTHTTHTHTSHTHTVNACMYTDTPIHTYACTHTPTHTCACTHRDMHCECMHACVYTHTHMHTHTPCMHSCTHIHTCMHKLVHKPMHAPELELLSLTCAKLVHWFNQKQQKRSRTKTHRLSTWKARCQTITDAPKAARLPVNQLKEIFDVV